MVDLPHIKELGEIIRTKDQESWIFSKQISLEELRALKDLVKDKAQIKLSLLEDNQIF